ncbi:hypothetical protein [Candidatus Agathobaculum pullicola]
MAGHILLDTATHRPRWTARRCLCAPRRRSVATRLTALLAIVCALWT